MMHDAWLLPVNAHALSVCARCACVGGWVGVLRGTWKVGVSVLEL